MSNHGYHTRNNTPPTENQTPQQSNVSTDQSSNDETSLIARLESKLLSRFDNLSTEFLNLKDIIIIKNLQIENERLRYPLNLIIICSNNMGDETTSKLQALLILFKIMSWKIKVIEIFIASGVEAKSADF